MKKLYIGLIASGVLIFGGILYAKNYTPEVDMSKVGQHFIEKRTIYFNDGYDAKVIYGDKDRLKIRVSFKNIEGSIRTGDITNSLRDRNDKIAPKEKAMIMAFFNSKETVKEILNYKWESKPRNMSIIKESYKVKESNGNKYFEPIYDKVSNKELNGTIDLKKMKIDKDNMCKEVSIFCGINGSGTIDMEIINVYK